MNFSAPSWDLFVVLFLVITIAYGFLLQRERIVVTMVAAYVGIVMSAMFAGPVQSFFTGDTPLLGKYFIAVNLSLSQIQIALFVLTLLLVSTKAGIDAEKGRGWLSPIELTILSTLTGALIVTTILSFMPIEQRELLAETSRLVMYLDHFHGLWTVAPIVGLIVLGLRRKGD